MAAGATFQSHVGALLAVELLTGRQVFPLTLPSQVSALSSEVGGAGDDWRIELRSGSVLDLQVKSGRYGLTADAGDMLSAMGSQLQANPNQYAALVVEPESDPRWKHLRIRLDQLRQGRDEIGSDDVERCISLLGGTRVAVRFFVFSIDQPSATELAASVLSHVVGSLDAARTTLQVLTTLAGRSSATKGRWTKNEIVDLLAAQGVRPLIGAPVFLASSAEIEESLCLPVSRGGAFLPVRLEPGAAGTIHARDYVDALARWTSSEGPNQVLIEGREQSGKSSSLLALARLWVERGGRVCYVSRELLPSELESLAESNCLTLIDLSDSQVLALPAPTLIATAIRARKLVVARRPEEPVNPTSPSYVFGSWLTSAFQDAPTQIPSAESPRLRFLVPNPTDDELAQIIAQLSARFGIVVEDIAGFDVAAAVRRETIADASIGILNLAFMVLNARRPPATPLWTVVTSEANEILSGDWLRESNPRIETVIRQLVDGFPAGVASFLRRASEFAQCTEGILYGLWHEPTLRVIWEAADTEKPWTRGRPDLESILVLRREHKLAGSDIGLFSLRIRDEQLALLAEENDALRSEVVALVARAADAEPTGDERTVLMFDSGRALVKKGAKNRDVNSIREGCRRQVAVELLPTNSISQLHAGHPATRLGPISFSAIGQSLRGIWIANGLLDWQEAATAARLGAEEVDPDGGHLLTRFAAFAVLRSRKCWPGDIERSAEISRRMAEYLLTLPDPDTVGILNTVAEFIVSPWLVLQVDPERVESYQLELLKMFQPLVARSPDSGEIWWNALSISLRRCMEDPRLSLEIRRAWFEHLQAVYRKLHLDTSHRMFWINSLSLALARIPFETVYSDSNLERQALFCAVLDQLKRQEPRAGRSLILDILSNAAKNIAFTPGDDSTKRLWLGVLTDEMILVESGTRTSPLLDVVADSLAELLGGDWEGVEATERERWAAVFVNLIAPKAPLWDGPFKWPEVVGSCISRVYALNRPDIDRARAARTIIDLARVADPGANDAFEQVALGMGAGCTLLFQVHLGISERAKLATEILDLSANDHEKTGSVVRAIVELAARPGEKDERALRVAGAELFWSHVPSSIDADVVRVFLLAQLLAFKHGLLSPTIALSLPPAVPRGDSIDLFLRTGTFLCEKFEGEDRCRAISSLLDEVERTFADEPEPVAYSVTVIANVFNRVDDATAWRDIIVALSRVERIRRFIRTASIGVVHHLKESGFGPVAAARARWLVEEARAAGQRGSILASDRVRLRVEERTGHLPPGFWGRVAIFDRT